MRIRQNKTEKALSYINTISHVRVHFSRQLVSHSTQELILSFKKKLSKCSSISPLKVANGGELDTGNSLSEDLIFASTNPQYDDRLFIDLPVQYVKTPSSEHGENMLCTEIVFDIQNNFCTQHVLIMTFSAKKEFLTKIYL